MCFCQYRVIFLRRPRYIFPHYYNSFVNMTHLRSIAGKLTIAILFAFFILNTGNAGAQDGKALFAADCASCHKIDQKVTGPALMGVEDRWNGDRTKLHAWIHNPAGFAKTDAYASQLIKDNAPTLMTAFGSSLSDKDIDAILDYIKNWKPPVAATPAAGAENPESGDNTLLFGILTLILAVIAFILLQVNANLKKMADDKEGIPALEPVPFWRNKTYIAFATVVLFLIGGYLTVNGAIGLGRSQDYEPRQPIFYSHKVHAGINQINCQYCHIGVYQGKQATIPSVNICMNCHMAINEYKGTEKLVDAEGKEINGTAEIQKLYKYARFEPGKPWDATKAEPIAWTRIHNLPDHVYFNHSQHVVAGKVQCQTCHGEITGMNEVYQFAPLSMGWCVNCHRTTKVNFPDSNGNGGNQFYSIYTKYIQGLKNHTMDSVTVENIGGTECQKCHY